jgi:LCP family protein required for cell wall assembly
MILGIPIHYSARIDFDGFRKGIDILGGVDVVVDKTFDDYQYPADGKDNATCKDGTYSCRFEHLHFNQGQQHLTGTQALKFVRSRKGTNGEGSDFARSRRQQKVLVSAKNKALKTENLLDPIKLNNLFKDFGQSVETDLDISALTAVFNLSKEIDSDNINSLVLDNAEDNYLYAPPANLYGGAYVLIPKDNSWSKIHSAILNLLSKTFSVSPQ